MRFLVLTFYYSPDLCAGSFRATPLVESLNLNLSIGDQIDVITTQPNRYRTYQVDADPVEQVEGVRVRRIAVPPHASGIVDQARSFLSYAVGALRATKGGRYDLVLATSSRLLTASLGAMIAKRTGAKLYLDIRDIFTDTISDLYGRGPIATVLPFLKQLERWTIRSASSVNLVSEGFRTHFELIAPEQRFLFVTNGVDQEFEGADFTKPSSASPLLVLYAGNVGAGQGLHRILPGLAEATVGRFSFRVVGDGGAMPELKSSLSGLSNVSISGPVSRDQLLKEYRAADILFLHLNDIPAFEKVLPSKIFEYAATGKPILAGVAGYARSFLKANVSNASVFDPCQIDDAITALNALDTSPRDRNQFVSKFSREKLMTTLAEDILEVARAN